MRLVLSYLTAVKARKGNKNNINHFMARDPSLSKNLKRNFSIEKALPSLGLSLSLVQARLFSYLLVSFLYNWVCLLSFFPKISISFLYLPLAVLLALVPIHFHFILQINAVVCTYCN